MMSNEALMELFRESGNDYLSGALISQKLGISRTAVWKQIRKLETAGYEFEASTKLGYRLLFEPDKLYKARIRDCIASSTDRFGQELLYEEEVPSTQNIARAMAEEGAPEGVLVVADQQTNGRGRMGRAWTSPNGKGIYMSLILKPFVPIHCAPQLTLLTAVALCRSLRRITKLELGIKWPNDLLCSGKKISGILLESAAEDDRLKYVIAGIGISVNMTEKDFPEETLAVATSLRMAAGASFDRALIIADFLSEWEQLYDLFQEDGFRSIASLWESLSVTIGKRVSLRTPQGVIIGTPEGLDESGALRIRRDNGETASIFSAEMGEPLS
ncbi:biotin--[acetyl-CoA-carboxylase] ligase [Paenibacillus sp. HB172176]|uniref:biotin--[acetyl-CoA-carboxylase] ligase n=1 Tax=Paenibacillus sp. HB172176 TaxID=2493690 RepID=UPI001438B54D|nr:biotin--[acetyl-CoA-carboxylase] ligase [Paenibacillus sp. HB172176]